jgi:uncharacterized protein with FMN-binding domain
MRRITMVFMATVAMVVLLFSYRTSTSGPRTSTVVTTGAPEGIVSDSGGTDAEPAPSTKAPATKAPATKAPATKSSGTTTVNGPVVQTRWGPVQVQVKITSNKITDVVVLQQPTGERRDEEINGYALPILHDEVIAAQSADIDTVSGATVTSDGYVQSLQAALDQANFRS